jgi:hypothetical protein
MVARYTMRKEPEGWTVCDVWTGWPAVIAGVPQTEMELDDADDLVDFLNGLHARGTVLTEMGPPLRRNLTSFREASLLGGLLIFGVGVVSWAMILFVFEKPLAIGAANGTYANSCCGVLTLKDGHASNSDVTFDYVVEPGKEGRGVLLTGQSLIAGGGRLALGEAKTGQFLRLSPTTPANWLEIDGAKFVRLGSANIL